MKNTFARVAKMFEETEGMLICTTPAVRGFNFCIFIFPMEGSSNLRLIYGKSTANLRRIGRSATNLRFAVD